MLAPLHDAAEMDVSAKAAVARLGSDSASCKTFADVFDASHGPSEAAYPTEKVTKARLGAALAAYVRSLKAPETPAMLALAGSNLELEARSGRGLDLFRGAGRCQSCHSGPGLTDGDLHVVAFRPKDALLHIVPLKLPPESVSPDSRPSPQLTAARAAALRGGRYGGTTMSLERQTLPLVDVGRTAPYFRDGSAKTLSDAVRKHASDLRQVGAQRAAILANPGMLIAKEESRAPKLPPERCLSLSGREQLATDTWIPPDLSSDQFDDLVAFLGSLSPGP